MPHQFESGFFVHQPAWHRLGKVLDNPPTTETRDHRRGTKLAGARGTNLPDRERSTASYFRLQITGKR